LVVFISAFMGCVPSSKTGKRRPRAASVAALIAAGHKKVKQSGCL
jgi:hypothetical protein